MSTHPSVRILAVLSLAAAMSTPTLAAPAPDRLPEVGAPDAPGTPRLSAGTCVLQTGAPSSFAYTFGSDLFTSVASLITPQSCTACEAPAALQVNSVSLRLRAFVPCEAAVQLLIVGTDGDPVCPKPDFANVLCGPQDFNITLPGPTTEFNFGLASPCCVDGPAFAVLRFLENPACGSGIAIRGTLTPATSCLQYFTTTTGYPTPTDWSFAGTPPLWVSVDADCCAPTPAAPHSWGRLKTLYR